MSSLAIKNDPMHFKIEFECLYSTSFLLHFHAPHSDCDSSIPCYSVPTHPCNMWMVPNHKALIPLVYLLWSKFFLIGINALKTILCCIIFLHSWVRKRRAHCPGENRRLLIHWSLLARCLGRFILSRKEGTRNDGLAGPKQEDFSSNSCPKMVV